MATGHTPCHADGPVWPSMRQAELKFVSDMDSLSPDSVQMALFRRRLTLNNALASSSQGRCWLQALGLLGRNAVPVILLDTFGMNLV